MRTSVFTLTLAAFAVHGAAALAQNPRPSIEADGAAFLAGAGTAVVADDNLVATLFREAGSDRLFVTSSHDGGATFSPPVQVNVTAGRKIVQSDSLHLIGTDAYCGWSVETGATAAPNTEEDFAFCIVDLSGPLPVVTTPEVLVPPSGAGFAAGQIRSYEFSACGGAEPNAAFLSAFDLGAADGPERAWVVTRPLGGPFTPPVALSPVAPNDTDHIALACDGDTFVAAWDVDTTGGGPTDTLFMNVNTSSGFPGSWTGPFLVNGSLADDVEDDIDVDVKAGKIFVTWLLEIGGAGDEDPFGRVFSLAGVPIGPEQKLVGAVGAGDADEIRGRLSAAGNPVAVFDYDTAGTPVVHASTSIDCGLSFLAEVPLSSDGGTFLEMADGPDGVVAATWIGGTAAAPTVETAYSCSNGLGWRVVADANTTSGDPSSGAIAYDDKKASIVLAFNSDALAAPSTDRFVGGFSVCSVASVAFRNAGTNPASLTVTDPPDLGGTFESTVDVSLTGHSSAFLFAFDTPITVVLAGGQSLLCIDGGGGELLTGAGVGPNAGPLAVFSLAVPNDPCLAGFYLCVQAMHALGVAPYALSNAQECVVGATD